MQPVWVLSVDLQTKTATFQSGLAGAAKSARGAFTEIKTGANEMGRTTSGSMMEARHGVMLLGEEFGVHLPRGLTMFISSLGPVGAAMEAAFPFLAIAVGATLLLEHLAKLREAGEKLTNDQAKFATAVQNAFNVLDQKLLQSQIRADELRNDHLGALRKQLELINAQSMDELVHSFEQVAKSADVVFGELKASWYQFGIGSAGAKHALDDFQNQYNSLLAQGKDKGASDLLAGTLKSAQRVLELQKQAKDNDGSLLSGPRDGADLGAAMRAENELKRSGVGFTEKEIQAQQALVDALTAQVGIEQKVSDLKKLDSGNTKHAAANADAARHSAAEKESAASQLRMGEQAIAADRSVAEDRLTIQRASVQDRLAVDLDFANREYQLRTAANQQDIAALDKSGKDYQNQLKALQDKALELTQQHETQVTELTSKAHTASAAKSLRDMEQSERENIAATQQGSAVRLAAINATLKEEERLGLQDTSFYRELLSQRVQLTRQMADQEAQLREAAGREDAANTQKMGELALAAERQQIQLRDSLRRVSDQQKAAEQTQLSNEEFALKMEAFERELAALDKSGKDYANKLKAIQDKEKQLVQAHENELTAIKDKAEEERNSRILSAEGRFNDEIARGLTSVLMRHESFAAMMDSIGSQVASGMLQNALKDVMSLDMTREKEAASAARKMFIAGTHFPFPANIVMAPTLGAMAFASMMAYAGGTDSVPGVGRGDVTPAMLTPGEGVVPGGVMDGLRSMARSGGMGGGTHYHIAVSPVYHLQAIDTTGVEKMLKTHTQEFSRHFHDEVRKMNR